MEQIKIQEQAKRIMDDFISALSKVGELKEELGVRRKKNLREKVNIAGDKDFSERMLKNAPKTKDRFILAEKKTW